MLAGRLETVAGWWWWRCRGGTDVGNGGWPPPFALPSLSLRDDEDDDKDNDEADDEERARA